MLTRVIMKFSIRCLILIMMTAVGAIPQTPDSATRSKNLNLCLSGRYPRLCNHSWLTAAQTEAVKDAEHRENLKTCLNGRYHTLCDHSRLSASELTAVREAERRENLSTCLTGRYPTLCNYSQLSPTELNQVREAENAENLRTCLTGRFPTLCNRSRLTLEEAKSVAEAEKRVAANSNTRSTISSQRRSRPGDCESGHWIDSVSSDGKVLKLEDGSVWLVDDVDTVISSLWLPTTEVIICSSKIINTDDNESVEATPLSSSEALERQTSGRQSYVLQASANDETFVINNHVFKAKTYCFNMQKGDRVIFNSGNPSGSCATAELFNLRTGKTCRVWCE